MYPKQKQRVFTVVEERDEEYVMIMVVEGYQMRCNENQRAEVYLTYYPSARFDDLTSSKRYDVQNVSNKYRHGEVF